MSTDFITLPEVSSICFGYQLLARTHVEVEKDGAQNSTEVWLQGNRAMQTLTLEILEKSIKLRLYYTWGAELSAESSDCKVRDDKYELVLELPTGEKIFLPMSVFIACGDWCAGWNR